MEQIKSLILRITERCNLQCTYCYAGSQCNGIDMTPELAIRAVSLCCPEGGSLRIQFTGGEPLLNLPVMEAVHRFGKATGRNLRLAIQTNGTLLTPEHCRTLAAMKCAVGVSLDGLGEANSLRLFPDGSPTFHAVAEGIRNLGALGLRCNLTTVVTRSNAAHLGQLPDLALWLGNVSGVGLDLFRPLGRGAEKNYAPDADDLSAGLGSLIRKTRAVQTAGVPFRLRELERLKKKRTCDGCGEIYCYAQTEQSLCVDGNGDFWPCSSLAGDPMFHLGNIRDGLPIRSRSVLSLDAPDSCRACESFGLCGGGCPAGRTARGSQPDPLTCTMNRILLEEFHL